jgi:hypothetical protein
MVPLEHRALLVLQVLQVVKEQQVLQHMAVLRELQAHVVLLVHKAIKGQLVRELQEVQEQLVLQVQ